MSADSPAPVTIVRLTVEHHGTRYEHTEGIPDLGETDRLIDMGVIYNISERMAGTITRAIKNDEATR